MKGEEKEQVGERSRNISMDQASMCEYGRFQDIERHGEERRCLTKEFPRINEDQRAESESQWDHHRPGPESDGAETHAIGLPETLVISPGSLHKAFVRIVYCRRFF